MLDFIYAFQQLETDQKFLADREPYPYTAWQLFDMNHTMWRNTLQ